MFSFATIMFIVLGLLAMVGRVTSCGPVQLRSHVLSHAKTSIQALETFENYDSLSVFYVEPKRKLSSIQSNFKEESEKTLYFDISLLETDVTNSSSSGINETYIAPFGSQLTLYEIAPVNKNSINKGFMSSTTACQNRNVDGNGAHYYCLATFTYTAKDSFNSSITFMVAYSQYSTNVWQSNNFYRTVSADGIYFGMTFDVQLSEQTIASISKYNFRFKEFTTTSNQIQPMVRRTLSAKESNPSTFTLDVTNTILEGYLTPAATTEVTGDVSASYSSAATYTFTFPLYDENGNFFGIYLNDQNQIDVMPHAPGVESLSNKVNHHKVNGQTFGTLSDDVTQAVNTIILNDIAASSITFIKSIPRSNLRVGLLTFKYISVASTGVFFGGKYEIILVHDPVTFELATITITEIINTKSLSFMIENNFVKTGQSEVLRGFKKQDDNKKIYPWPSFQVSWNPNSMNGAIFKTLAYDLEHPAGDQLTNYYSYMQTSNGDTIQITYVCQFLNLDDDFVICQTTVTYMVGSGGDSSITFVISLSGAINFVPCSSPRLELVPVDKIVRSISGTGAYFGETYSVRVVYNDIGSLDLTFTDTVAKTLKPTSKPANKPNSKPTNKPNSKQTKKPTSKPVKNSDDKKSNDKRASVNVGSSSTGSKSSVGTIVGIIIGAFLIIWLLICAYFWYMKKNSLLHLESKIVPISLANM